MDEKETHKKSSIELSFIEEIQYTIITNLRDIFCFLGFSFIKYLGKILGFLMWHVLRDRRALAIRNIRRTLGFSPSKAKKIARKSFDHNARSFLEIALVKKFSFNPQEVKLNILNPKEVQQLYNPDYPVVGVTAHMGAWEFLAAFLGEIKRETQGIVVVRQYPNNAVHKFITDCREALGAKMIGHKMAAPVVLRALKKKALVAFLVDHKAKKQEALYMDFLGIRTSVNIGPALLALRGKALVVPLFLLRDKNDTDYVVHSGEALDTTKLTGTREENIRYIAEFYTKAVEKIIRQYPEQWFWMHNRWKG